MFTKCEHEYILREGVNEFMLTKPSINRIYIFLVTIYFEKEKKKDNKIFKRTKK